MIGRLGNDPKFKELEKGTKVANFSIATTETWKDKDGNNQESTEWHNIVLWDDLAEIAKNWLKKGKKKGQLKHNSTKKDLLNSEKKLPHF